MLGSEKHWALSALRGFSEMMDRMDGSPEDEDAEEKYEGNCCGFSPPC
jgi:hypothetical protein